MTIVTRELWEQIKGSPLDTIWQERRRMARTIKTLIINWPSFSPRVRTNIEEIQNSRGVWLVSTENIARISAEGCRWSSLVFDTP